MNISEFAAIVWRQRIAVIGVLVLGVLAFLVAVPTLRKFTAQSTVLASSAGGMQSAVLDPSKDPVASAVSPGDLPSLATSAVVLERVAADLNIPSRRAISLAGHIKVRPPLASDVIPIAFTDRTPREAIEGVNAVTRELVRYNREIGTARYDGLIHDLQMQLGERRSWLLRYDEKIARLTAADPYVTAEAGNSAIDTHLLALEQQRSTLQAAMMGDQASAGLTAQRPNLTKDLAKHEIAAADPVVTALKGQYGKDLASLNNVKATYTEQYPGLTGLQHTVDSENKSLTKTVDTVTAKPSNSASYVSAMLDANKANAQLASDRAQLATVDRQIESLSSHLSNSRGENTQINSLRRERAAGEAAFSELQTRLAKATADRSQAETINSLVVIDTATYASLATFSRPEVIGLALLALCTWLAITLAFLLDGADKRLRKAEDIEELYGAPVMAPVG